MKKSTIKEDNEPEENYPLRQGRGLGPCGNGDAYGKRFGNGNQRGRNRLERAIESERRGIKEKVEK